MRPPVRATIMAAQQSRGRGVSLYGHVDSSRRPPYWGRFPLFPTWAVEVADQRTLGVLLLRQTADADPIQTPRSDEPVRMVCTSRCDGSQWGGPSPCRQQPSRARRRIVADVWRAAALARKGAPCTGGPRHGIGVVIPSPAVLSPSCRWGHPGGIDGRRP